MAMESKVKLRSCDNDLFEVEESVAYESRTVKNMIEDTGIENEIPLPNVSSRILTIVMEYCKCHAQSQKKMKQAVAKDEIGQRESQKEKQPINQDEIEQWHAEFTKVDQETLFHLIMAANYLDIKDLLDLTCQTVADIIKSKPVEEIRTIFNIKSDFTAEEEKTLRQENQWAFE